MLQVCECCCIPVTLGRPIPTALRAAGPSHLNDVLLLLLTVPVGVRSHSLDSSNSAGNTVNQSWHRTFWGALIPSIPQAQNQKENKCSSRVWWFIPSLLLLLPFGRLLLRRDQLGRAQSHPQKTARRRGNPSRLENKKMKTNCNRGRVHGGLHEYVFDVRRHIAKHI
jgi:hypothetical protein